MICFIHFGLSHHPDSSLLIFFFFFFLICLSITPVIYTKVYGINAFIGPGIMLLSEPEIKRHYLINQFFLFNQLFSKFFFNNSIAKDKSMCPNYFKAFIQDSLIFSSV